ncbi:hypothetical protein [Ferrovum sp.]|uniref:hypothetical protein n=1 Tax=Ferrovum sp. TaxID=2609467 RepID=UPI002635BB3E|nr:hypothetical protein [Ferrovum sp.]
MRIFSPHHKIWQFAVAGGELDDWLSQAEELMQKWSNQNSDEVRFGTFDVILAAYLLKDNLLPASARDAFAELMMSVIIEARKKKLRIECLHIEPPKPGRKENRTERFIRFHEVRMLKNGMTATEAYKVTADKFGKDPVTIRREYERVLKRLKERKKTGEND